MQVDYIMYNGFHANISNYHLLSFFILPPVVRRQNDPMSLSWSCLSEILLHNKLWENCTKSLPVLIMTFMSTNQFPIETNATLGVLVIEVIFGQPVLST